MKKSTVTTAQGQWVPFSSSLVHHPAWSKRQCPAHAWRVLWWLTNRQTGSAKVEEETYGVVAGGSPVAFSTIAKDLGCTWRVVQKSVKWLAENDLITASGSRGVLNVFHLKETARTFEVKEQAPEEPQVDRPTVFHIEGDDDELA